MKSPRMLLIAVVATSALAVFLARSLAQPVAWPAAPLTRVAVCDVAAVFNDYQRAKDLNTKFSGKREAIAAEDEKRRQKILQVEKMLDALRPGSKEHEARLGELQRLSVERTVWRKLQEQKAIREHRRLTEEMYSEILDVIAAVAKSQGYDLVMYRETVPIASQTTTELLNKIAQRKCLYYNPAIDLTDTVLKRVNSQYSKRPK